MGEPARESVLPLVCGPGAQYAGVAALPVAAARVVIPPRAEAYEYESVWDGRSRHDVVRRGIRAVARSEQSAAVGRRRG